jgi:opacity protein-like surface antigen
MIMKKIFMIACMMLASTAMFAEKGATTVGVHGAYIIDSPNNIGVGANVGYEIIDNLRGVAELDYFLKKDDVSYWDVNVGAQYLFKLGDSFAIYPTAGIDLLGFKASYPEVTYMGQTVGGGSHSDSKIGMNVGAGVEYQLSSSLAIKAEYNYKTQWDGSSFLKVGVVIPF